MENRQFPKLAVEGEMESSINVYLKRIKSRENV